MVCEPHDFLLRQLHNKSIFNISFFWIVSCPLPLHVECFLPLVVGVGDNQTMSEAYQVFISFNVALCAYVIGCFCARVIE